MSRPHRLSLFAALLLVAPLSGTAAPNGWNVVDHLPLETIVLQSHRGAGVLAEENTLEAFQLGWSLGTYPESDVRTTRDGVIVAFHDADFRRVVKDAPPDLAKQGVKDLTFAELSRLDVGSWKGNRFQGRRVCRLADVFALMTDHRQRHLYLDIKDVDFDALAQEVRAARVEAQIVLASPRPEQLRSWKERIPTSDTLLWMRGSEEQLRGRIAELEADGFTGITQLQVHIFPNRSLEEALAIAGISAARLGVSLEQARTSDEPFTLSRSFIRELGGKLRRHHIVFQALPYTSDPGVYAELLDLGLMSFATDHPDITQRELKTYYARHPGGAAAEPAASTDK